MSFEGFMTGPVRRGSPVISVGRYHCLASRTPDGSLEGGPHLHEIRIRYIMELNWPRRAAPKRRNATGFKNLPTLGASTPCQRLLRILPTLRASTPCQRLRSDANLDLEAIEGRLHMGRKSCDKRVVIQVRVEVR